MTDSVFRVLFAYFGRELKRGADMLEHLGDYMANVKGELKLISKHVSMVTTQVEQVLNVGERSNFKKNPTHTQDHGDA